MTCRHRHLLTATAITTTALLGPGCYVTGFGEDFGGHAFDVCTAPSIGAKFGAGGYPPVDQPGIDRDRVSFVMAVDPGSPAERAGLKQWDVVTRVDGDAFATPIAIRETVAFKRRGDMLALQIVRAGEPINITVPVDAD